MLSNKIKLICWFLERVGSTHCIAERHDDRGDS